ncbi:hypothetical protein BKA70DRAFT_1427651 [Coprinopsis sp. MPI-PUGE-AT-0042]|nr:hypothetical protein BKA70DRAFT_1427651 [Coprinopsis sp. MPI-PUGE-AT-0042]
MSSNSENTMLEELQRDMGLDSDPDRFDTFQRVFAQNVLKLRWNRSKNACHQSPQALARLVWKMKDCLPFLHGYGSWPILSLLEIHLVSLQMKEAQFRQRSDSQATLPDFPLAEIGDEKTSVAWSS